MIPWGLPLNERSVGFCKEMVASRRPKRRVGPSCPARKTMRRREVTYEILCERFAKSEEGCLRAVIMKPTRIYHPLFRDLERKP